MFSKTFHYPNISNVCEGWLLNFLWMPFQTFCSGRFDWQHNMVTLSLLNDVALKIINGQISGRTSKEYFLDRSCLPPHLKPEQTAGEALPLMLLCKYLVTVSKSCLEPELAPTPLPYPTPTSAIHIRSSVLCSFFPVALFWTVPRTSQYMTL